MRSWLRFTILYKRRLGVLPMNAHSFRVLIFGRDQDALLTLQHVFKNAGLDITITWDEADTRKWARTMQFDVSLLCDCPPGLMAESLRHELGNKPRCQLIVLVASRGEIEHFGRLGFAVIDKRDPVRVLEQVQQCTYAAAA